MPRRSCDGTGLLVAFRSAVACLEVNVDEVNAMNVFPVPDGDTGSNMLATVRAALEEADKLDRDADAAGIAHAVSFGALMGARGNSGVIASQILAGIAEGLAGKRRFDGLDLAHALDAGSRKAYRAVARPVEGTILTVIREASAAAITTAERDNNVETVLAATVVAAERSVARTPSLLPILREAHVVDSGGQGLLRLFQGALQASRDQRSAASPGRIAAPIQKPPHTRAATDPSRADVNPSRAGAGASGDHAFGYETVFVVQAVAGGRLDTVAITEHLEAIGESVLVAGNERLVKVHVHNDRPDIVISYGLELGALSRITVENLDTQTQDVREAKAAAFLGGVAEERRDHADARVRVAMPSSAPGPAAVKAAAMDVAVGQRAAERPDAESDADPETRPSLGVVAVAPSDGLAALLTDQAAPFREYGAFRVVRGGQGANPSTGELFDAVRATRADELLILPNNPNVVLAARQVVSMLDRPAHVVPTRNCAEGIAALFALDPSRSAADNARAMADAGRAIQTFQVTEAVRDATVSGRRVRKGQTIVLDPDDGLLAVDNDSERAVLAAFGRLEPGFAVVTIYYGLDATLEAAESLARRIQEAAPGLEAVELAHGGQPHYRYLIAAE